MILTGGFLAYTRKSYSNIMAGLMVRIATNPLHYMQYLTYIHGLLFFLSSKENISSRLARIFSILTYIESYLLSRKLQIIHINNDLFFG
jgi:uncharacterized membrane protein